MSTDTQGPDGRWIPAQPLPFYKDTRPWLLIVWHLFLTTCWGYDEDKLAEPWYVPMEKPDDISKERG